MKRPPMARYHVVHETLYEYTGPVALSQQLLHLTPRTAPRQRLLAHAIRVEPVPTERWQRQDYFGNTVEHIAVQSPHDRLHVVAESAVEVAAPEIPPRPGDSPAWEQVRERLAQVGPAPLLEPSQFLYESPHVRLSPELVAYARPSFAPRRPLLAAVLDLMGRIHADFEFDPHATTVATPLEEVLQHKSGVCQDFAHLMIGCLRAHGLAARYVSGYLLTTPPPGRPRLVGADASHAWVSVFCPLSGWLDFDPTNNLLPETRHITLSFGRDFGDVSPLRGVILGSGEQKLNVKVTVSPLAEGAGTSALA